MRSSLILVAAFGLSLIGFDRPAPAEEKEELTKPLFSLAGRKSKITKAGYHRIESEKAWDALWLRHHTGKPERDTTEPLPPQFAKVDFKKCMVVAVFQGAHVNCNGYEVHSITEDKDRVLVRVKGMNFQTVGNFAETEAWGVFVLPKSNKLVVFEMDTRSLIAEPPKWTKEAELKPGDVTTEK